MSNITNNVPSRIVRTAKKPKPPPSQFDHTMVIVICPNGGHAINVPPPVYEVLRHLIKDVRVWFWDQEEIGGPKTSLFRPSYPASRLMVADYGTGVYVRSPSPNIHPVSLETSNGFLDQLMVHEELERDPPLLVTSLAVETMKVRG